MEEQKPEIIYIDDEDVNLFLFNQLFQKQYKIHTCLSADEGLKKLDENKDIKVAIVDMNMPDKDGLMFINEAKHKHKDIIYMILTGYSVNEEINNAIKNDAISKYLSKPFDVKTITNAINSALENTK